ncbi:MAG: peptide chain release factor 1 [Bacteroidetes bacterium GWF2_33_16]|nr:MAG: peptide chain release factor 1 [Bacteroidetes bacterium GWE2_32_14]OFY07067.1 MAG: peptide chain release factor 1 [Bacteroidetes bacterium GWF2_33_16]
MLAKESLKNELIFKATRSSGSGGQNVNKVSTKMELRFQVDDSEFLTYEEKELIKVKLKNRISQDGFFILTCDTERTQLANKKNVIELFFELIEKALHKPKKRKKTRPSKASIEKRLKGKKIQSEKKKNRSLE